jgi:hypothetical protein
VFTVGLAVAGCLVALSFFLRQLSRGVLKPYQSIVNKI